MVKLMSANHNWTLLPFSLVIIYNSNSVVKADRTRIKEGETCDLHDGTKGICTPMETCEWYDIQKANKLKSDDQLFICDWGIYNPIICCENRNMSATISFPPVDARMVAPTKTERACSYYESEIGFWRILNGEAATNEEFPHIAFLLYDSPSLRCGGTIISSQYVLTAAHCANNTIGKLVKIRVGQLNALQASANSDYNIAEIIVHFNYVPKNNQNDIALLKLAKHIEFNDAIFPACLNTNIEDISSFVGLTACGWGVTETNNRASNILRKVILATEPLSKCREFYQDLYNRNHDDRYKHGLIDGQMCAKDFTNRSRDTCQGDSGGPLQKLHKNGLYKIYGLTSFGQNCGSNAPAIYTRIAAYIEWIESHVEYRLG